MDQEIDRLDWLILDAFSDDVESTEQIADLVQPDDPAADMTLIASRLAGLLARGLVYDAHPPGGWYGMTEVGCQFWERLATTFGDGPPDWSVAWVIDFDLKAGCGSAVGATREVCESALRTNARRDIVIDPSSFTHHPVASFRAKYYQKVGGGHRIDFRCLQHTPQSDS
jgi:hypothetical protein